MPKSVMPPIDFFGEFRTPAEKARRAKAIKESSDAMFRAMAEQLEIGDGQAEQENACGAGCPER